MMSVWVVPFREDIFLLDPPNRGGMIGTPVACVNANPQRFQPQNARAPGDAT